jgi:hypothetical protein
VDDDRVRLGPEAAGRDHPDERHEIRELTEGDGQQSGEGDVCHSSALEDSVEIRPDSRLRGHVRNMRRIARLR